MTGEPRPRPPCPGAQLPVDRGEPDRCRTSRRPGSTDRRGDPLPTAGRAPPPLQPYLTPHCTSARRGFDPSGEAALGPRRTLDGPERFSASSRTVSAAALPGTRRPRLCRAALAASSTIPDLPPSGPVLGRFGRGWQPSRSPCAGVITTARALAGYSPFVSVLPASTSRTVAEGSRAFELGHTWYGRRFPSPSVSPLPLPRSARSSSAFGSRPCASHARAWLTTASSSPSARCVFLLHRSPTRDEPLPPPYTGFARG